MKKVLYLFFLLTLIQTGHTIEGPEIRCGIALGYPPYQYTNEKNDPVGIDVEVTRKIFQKAGLKMRFVQKEWGEIYSMALHNDGVDALCGIEVSTERAPHFAFSEPFNRRKIVLFTLYQNKIKSIRELFGKIITGDKHSSFEKYLGSDSEHIRVLETNTKEESFQKLKEGSVTGVIAPLEVGVYLAKKLKLKVSIYEENSESSPMVIAFAKNQAKYIPQINAALLKLQEDGTIKQILNKYSQREK